MHAMHFGAKVTEKPQDQGARVVRLLRHERGERRAGKSNIVLLSNRLWKVLKDFESCAGSKVGQRKELFVNKLTHKILHMKSVSNVKGEV